jgi:hypothetical protein
MALYNYSRYEAPAGTEAQILIDMGAENTELLVYTATSVWPRSLPISGNDFTEAIAEKFKLPFDKAEALKRMAKQSKHSAEIYRALEPPLRRLVEEIQRSIGFYKSINPGTRVTGILALGGSFRLPGLAKYLSENLRLPIRSLTEPQNFDLDVARNPRLFQESALSFGVALGLVVQGCGLGEMAISLLPQELLQRKIIARKKPYAAAVAACALLMFGTAWASAYRLNAELLDAKPKRAEDIVKQAAEKLEEYRRLPDVGSIQKKLDEIQGLWTDRDLWLEVLRRIFRPILPEPENTQGVWLSKVVSARIPFDGVAQVMASQGGATAISGGGLLNKPDSLEIEPSFLDRFKVRETPREFLTGFGGPGGPRGGGAAPEEKKVRRPDVVYMIIEGDTSHPDRERYVETSYARKLTNKWHCQKCDVDYEGPQPPKKCLTEGCEAVAVDFVLVDAPLFLNVRLVSSRYIEKFLNYQGQVVSLSDEDLRIWIAIKTREAEMLVGKIKNWKEGERGGEVLPTRQAFLADLMKKGIKLEMFTEFDLALFIDPSTVLPQEVERLKAEAERQRRQMEKMGLGGAPK